MAERDFVEKLQKSGFREIEVVERRPFGVNDCALYPLFTEELITMMRELLPPEKQDAVAISIVVKAQLGCRAT